LQLVFKCPICSSGADLDIDDEQIESIKKAILDHGRSPTLLSKCDDGHELLVTLYFRDDELGIRDVAVPLDPNGEKKEKPTELDWVRSTFGGNK
jgi:hypothetical protein